MLVSYPSSLPRPVPNQSWQLRNVETRRNEGVDNPGPAGAPGPASLASHPASWQLPCPPRGTRLAPQGIDSETPISSNAQLELRTAAPGCSPLVQTGLLAQRGEMSPRVTQRSGQVREGSLHLLGPCLPTRVAIVMIFNPQKPFFQMQCYSEPQYINHIKPHLPSYQLHGAGSHAHLATSPLPLGF